MYFTQDDYRRIEEWLRTRTVKDTQFPKADPLTGFEEVPIIQDGKNKVVDLDTFIRQLSLMELPDFLNVTTFTKRGHLSLEEAVNSIPVEQRKLGLTITYYSEKGNWMIYQFKGTSLNQWDSLNYWRSIVEEAIAEFVYHPDEEDITGVRDGNRTFLKFKDKDYDPAEFSGMGRIMLRKNLVGTEACAIDDNDHYSNILKQDMIMEENTIYIVQYDFDLDGKAISIPKGCTLWFQGGSINNGTIYLQETAILGAFEFADMGNAKLFGKFNTGQIMTFSNDSYKAKEGGYFIPSTKPSSATPQEDAKQDRETFYDKNPNAYTTETRQELRWWNGEEWILILDITDYNELKSIINDLIEKHNAEMSACYKYFKARCYALEVRMDDAETRLDEHDTTLENHETRITKVEGDIVSINNEINSIHNDIDNIEGDINTINNNITNIEGDINSIEQNITNVTNDISNITNNIADIQNIVENLDQTIENHIQQFIENNVVGVASVTVNGQKYVPDSNGNIALPDYPDVTPSGGGTADKVAHKLIFQGAVEAEYDGSNEVTVTIPSGGGGGGEVQDIDWATSSIGGKIKLGSDTTIAPADDVYPVQLDNNKRAFVKVPSSGGGGEVGDIPIATDSILGKIKTTYPWKELGLGITDPDKDHRIETAVSAEGELYGVVKPLVIKAPGIEKTYAPNKNVLIDLTSAFEGAGGGGVSEDEVNKKIELASLGSSNNPVVLFAGVISRSSSGSSTWSATGNKNKAVGSIRVTVSNSQQISVSFNANSGYSIYPQYSSTEFVENFDIAPGSTITWNPISTGGGIYWIQSKVINNFVYIRSACQNNNHNDAWAFWGLAPNSANNLVIKSMYLIVYGYATKNN